MNPNPSNSNPKPSMHRPQEVAQACCRTLTHAPVLPCLWRHLFPAALYGRLMQHLQQALQGRNQCHRRWHRCKSAAISLTPPSRPGLHTSRLAADV